MVKAGYHKIIVPIMALLLMGLAPPPLSEQPQEFIDKQWEEFEEIKKVPYWRERYAVNDMIMLLYKYKHNGLAWVLFRQQIGLIAGEAGGDTKQSMGDVTLIHSVDYLEKRIRYCDWILNHTKPYDPIIEQMYDKLNGKATTNTIAIMRRAVSKACNMRNYNDSHAAIKIMNTAVKQMRSTRWNTFNKYGVFEAMSQIVGVYQRNENWKPYVNKVWTKYYRACVELKLLTVGDVEMVRSAA